MNMQKDFHRNLIKGKIAEIVFQEMLAEVGKYTILPLGYERVLPGLLDRRSSSILKPIRSAPDFILIPKDEKDDNILIVEVKFSRNYKKNDFLFETAKEQDKKWKPSYLFIATPRAFHFGKCEDVVRSRSIKKLEESLVSLRLQNKYLKILKEFLDK